MVLWKWRQLTCIEQKGKKHGKKAAGGISRGLEFWREFVEDGACCDRVSLRGQRVLGTGKVAGVWLPAAGGGPGLRGAPGLGRRRGRRGGRAGWCGTRRAPRWSGLRRVKAGGDEAGGCGRSAAGARGGGHRARRASPSAGPGRDPSAALFPVARVACPPSRCPGRPSALSVRAAPRYSAPGPLFRRLRRSVGAAARPASRLHLHSTVLPPVPLLLYPSPQ